MTLAKRGEFLAISGRSNPLKGLDARTFGLYKPIEGPA